MSTSTMIIVAGHITVRPEQREEYLAGCVDVVELARRADGCLDFAISADLIEPGWINIYERWTSRSTLDAFRGSGPGDDQSAAMLSVSVTDYDVTQ